FLTGNVPFINELGFPEYEQVEGTLGLKMKEAFQYFSPKHKLVMIGTDCPELTSEIIAKAYKELETKDVVFGPSEDGGYYLIGMRPYCKELLEEISWSTDSVLNESMEKCRKLGKSFALLPELNDIDTIEDLRASKLTSTFDF
ncbi:MAG: TIGR04282 family arsenosugar biosynthesis glycosyltransferase, partial [Flavobacteriales bacterium]